MKKLVFYISDVGWGHATRQISLIKKAIESGFEIYIRNKIAQNILAFYFRNEIKTGKLFLGSSLLNDPGWPESYPIVKTQLLKKIKKWVDDLDLWISEESSFLKKISPDLVISDAVAGAFEVAYRLGIPSVFVSNLNWYDEYRHILGDFDILQIFKDFYRKATHVFILPFESNNTVFNIFERAPLLVRKMDSERIHSIRRELFKRYRPELIATFTLGGFYRDQIVLHKAFAAMKEASKKANVLWLIPNYLVQEGILCHTVKDYDFNNFIAASDFVFAKCGYGVISEAISGRIFGIYIYRSQVLEDTCITEDIVLSNWGVRYPMDGNYSIPLEIIFSVDKSEPSKRLREDGASYIMKRIMEKFL